MHELFGHLRGETECRVFYKNFKQCSPDVKFDMEKKYAIGYVCINFCGKSRKQVEMCMDATDLLLNNWPGDYIRNEIVSDSPDKRAKKSNEKIAKNEENVL